MPRFCAHATPPKVTGPAPIFWPSFGTSMRDSVLIGPRSDQPSLVQYASVLSKRVNSRSTTHLVAETKPYRPGTTSRAG